MLFLNYAFKKFPGHHAWFCVACWKVDIAAGGWIIVQPLTCFVEITALELRFASASWKHGSFREWLFVFNAVLWGLTVCNCKFRSNKKSTNCHCSAIPTVSSSIERVCLKTDGTTGQRRDRTKHPSRSWRPYPVDDGTAWQLTTGQVSI